MRHFVEDRLWCVGCVASVHETALTKVFFCPVIAAVTTFKLCGACVFCLTVALGYISREELLQDWNYRLRKPCGYNLEAPKPEEILLKFVLLCGAQPWNGCNIVGIFYC